MYNVVFPGIDADTLQPTGTKVIAATFETIEDCLNFIATEFSHSMPNVYEELDANRYYSVIEYETQTRQYYITVPAWIDDTVKHACVNIVDNWYDASLIAEEYGASSQFGGIIDLIEKVW